MPHLSWTVLQCTIAKGSVYVLSSVGQFCAMSVSVVQVCTWVFCVLKPCVSVDLKSYGRGGEYMGSLQCVFRLLGVGETAVHHG